MFKIKGDMKPITRQLTKMQSKLIPSAAAKAIKINMAKKHQLYGDIHIKPIQWGYLQYQVEGGTSNRVDIPTSKLKLNKYGNIPGKRTGYVKGNKFIKTIGGIKGVWLKTGGKRNSKLKLLVVLDKTVTYRKRFAFYKIAGGVARAIPKKLLQSDTTSSYQIHMICSIKGTISAIVTEGFECSLVY
jgi:hypothetical protein